MLKMIELHKIYVRNSMLKTLLTTITIMCITNLAHAEWIAFDTDEEYTTYIDPTRTVSKYDSLQQGETWLKLVIHTDLTKDGLSVGDYKLLKYGFKCKSSELGLLAFYSYQKSKLYDSYVFNYPKYEPAIPDTKGETILYAVCAGLYGTE
jgi:hypothetical protein